MSIHSETHWPREYRSVRSFSSALVAMSSLLGSPFKLLPIINIFVITTRDRGVIVSRGLTAGCDTGTCDSGSFSSVPCSYLSRRTYWDSLLLRFFLLSADNISGFTYSAKVQAEQLHVPLYFRYTDRDNEFLAGLKF